MSPPGAYPPAIARLIEEFASLPGVGRRSAERLAFHVLAQPRAEALRLAQAVTDAKTCLSACAACFNVAEGPPGTLCALCADPGRDGGLLCVVELPRDIIALEKSGGFRGRYHVLQGRLSPADGLGPDRLRVAELGQRLRAAAAGGLPVAELVLATNPTAEGDATASYVAGFARRPPEGPGGQPAWPAPRVTRLARGLSAGAELENAAPSALQFALEGRREM